jgi:hypothetical protein
VNDISGWSDAQLTEAGWSWEQIKAHRTASQIVADIEVMAHSDHYGSTQKKKSRKWLVWLIILTPFSAICAGIIYVVKNGLPF